MFHPTVVVNKCMCHGTSKVTYTEEQLKGLFKRFVMDGDRRLSKQELNQAFTNLGSDFPAWRTWRALFHADEHGDGYINEQEFDSLAKYAVKPN